MELLVSIGVLAAMLAAVAVIPLGLPGLWLIVATVLGLVLAGQLSWTFGLVVAASAGVAEAAELLVLRGFGKRFGGSRKAFWGAVVGGMAGLFVGIPVPIVGPIVTALVGTFVGAGFVTWLETRSVARSTRVGWGLLLARTAAVGLKVATAVTVIAFVAVALLL